MPNWKFHDKWADKMGIAQNISRYVNVHEDKIWRHDRYKGTDLWGRFNFMKQRGSDYLKAWILHRLLDSIEETGCIWDMDDQKHYYEHPYAKESIERTINQIETCPETKVVEKFIINNLAEILADFQELYSNFKVIQLRPKKRRDF